jgi:hypothetical protein
MEWGTVDSGYVLIAYRMVVFFSLTLLDRTWTESLHMKSDWARSTSCSRCSKPLWQTRYYRIGAGKLFRSIAILLRILLNSAYIGVMLCKADCNCNLHLLKFMPYCWQPDHLLDDADSAAKKIGFDRAERSSYTFRSLLAGGAQLAFGSDWPVRDSADISVTEICFFSVTRYIVPVFAGFRYQSLTSDSNRNLP